MWICKQCGETLDADTAPPNVDEQGFFFICPSCGKRNVLKNVGGKGEDDGIVLAQLDS